MLTDTRGTGMAGPPVQCKGTAEDMLSSGKWTVADLLFISVQQPQISATYWGLALKSCSDTAFEEDFFFFF